MSPAERTRRWRALDKVGTKVIDIPITANQADALVRLGRLREECCDDREEMTAAVLRLLADLEEDVTRHAGNGVFRVGLRLKRHTD